LERPKGRGYERAAVRGLTPRLATLDNVASGARTRAIVAAVAVTAAVVAGAVAWTGRGEEGSAPAAQGGPREGAPPLALDALVDDPAQATALQSAAELYESGRRRAALDAFNKVLDSAPDSLYAGVGAALSLWPDGTLAQLRVLEATAPQSGLVQLHLGLALLWEGRQREAEEAWRRAEEVDPDSPAAVRAESLLHPDFPAGRPFFVPAQSLPQDLAALLPAAQLAELKERAESSDSLREWMDYGVALQRAGKPLSARAAFDRAVEIEPADPEALAAAAVVRFDKDDPSEAFSRLGPLAERFPDAAVIRFHLGLCLLWLSRVEDARKQLELAVSAADGGLWSREASQVLARLDEAAAQGG
jgi:tetratricopeptide (TPR) repeat protein